MDERKFKENFARNHHSISKLTSRIMNTILVNLESSANRSVAGKLVVGKVWRSIYVDDNTVFIKDFQDDMGKILENIGAKSCLVIKRLLSLQMLS